MMGSDVLAEMCRQGKNGLRNVNFHNEVLSLKIGQIT